MNASSVYILIADICVHCTSAQWHSELKQLGVSEQTVIREACKAAVSGKTLPGIMLLSHLCFILI